MSPSLQQSQSHTFSIVLSFPNFTVPFARLLYSLYTHTAAADCVITTIAKRSTSCTEYIPLEKSDWSRGQKGAGKGRGGLSLSERLDGWFGVVGGWLALVVWWWLSGDDDVGFVTILRWPQARSCIWRIYIRDGLIKMKMAQWLPPAALQNVNREIVGIYIVDRWMNMHFLLLLY